MNKNHPDFGGKQFENAVNSSTIYFNSEVDVLLVLLQFLINRGQISIVDSSSSSFHCSLFYPGNTSARIGSAKCAILSVEFESSWV